MIFSWLASRAALGALFSLLFVPPRDFGRGFHRFAGFLATLLLGAAVAGGAFEGAMGWAALAGALGWVALTHWGPPSWFRPTLAPVVLICAVAALGGKAFPPRAQLLEAGFLTISANDLAAAALLGSVGLAMLLGHWYLIIPGLEIGHLRRLTRLLGACIVCRGAIVAVSVATTSSLPESGGISAWRVAAVQEGFFFWNRIGIGLVAPAILAVLVDRTVRIRSTQSATGLLYVAIVLVLMGEMMSRFLFVAAGIPQ